jgi:hypothetical protein
VVLLGGTTVVVKAAHVRLCHSRMLFFPAYPRETQEMVFNAQRGILAFGRSFRLAWGLTALSGNGLSSTATLTPARAAHFVGRSSAKR